MSHLSRWKMLGIVLTALIVCLFAVPNFFSEATVKNWPVWAQRRIALDIDLQGGSRLLLKVDSNYVKQQTLRQILHDARVTLREARIPRPALSIKGDAVEVRVQDASAPSALVKLRDWSQQLGEFNQLEVTDAGEGLIRLSLSQAAFAEQLHWATERSIIVLESILDRCVGELGTVQRQGAGRILVELPGLQNRPPLMNCHWYPARLEFRMVDTSISPDQARQGGLPVDSELLMSASQPNVPYVVKKQVVISGSDVGYAQLGFDQRTNEPVVNVKFNLSGVRRFARFRAENAGLPLAVVLGGQVVAAPVSFEPITRAQGRLSANFAAESAKELLVRLLAGALPGPLTVVEERTVGTDLGRNSTESDRIRAMGQADPTASGQAP